jgi:hypothetical protein
MASMSPVSATTTVMVASWSRRLAIGALLGAVFLRQR